LSNYIRLYIIIFSYMRTNKYFIYYYISHFEIWFIQPKSPSHLENQ